MWNGRSGLMMLLVEFGGYKMRVTRKQLEYYVSILNGHLEEHNKVTLDISYGGYKLMCDHMELVPYRMTCRECYYVVLGMLNNEICKLRYKNARD